MSYIFIFYVVHRISTWYFLHFDLLLMKLHFPKSLWRKCDIFQDFIVSKSLTSNLFLYMIIPCKKTFLLQMLALSCLDKLIELDPRTNWVSFLSSRGYLKHLIGSLLDSEGKLLSVLEPVPATLRPLYLYESKMVSRAKTMRSIKIEIFRHEWVNLLTCLTFLPFFHFFPHLPPPPLFFLPLCVCVC